MEIRTLRADEIECRAAMVKERGVSLLLYKDARCDMRILDEMFTPFGWQRHHETINGKEFCTVSVKSETGEWIEKQDCGTESNTEKEKGQSSDAFKRACFNWGIGRELYTAPFIWIPEGKAEIQKNSNGKYYLKNSFEVSEIQYDKDRKISGLVIVDAKTKNTVYSMDQENAAVQAPPQQYICERCGRPVKGYRKKSGEAVEPKTVYESTGHLCMSCWEQEKQK